MLEKERLCLYFLLLFFGFVVFDTWFAQRLTNTKEVVTLSS